MTDPTNGIRIWQSTLSPDLLWLGDHRVDNACVLPGAAYAELALAAATDTFSDDEPWAIRELCLDQVMPVVDGTIVVTTLSGDESKPRVEIRTRKGASGWTTHATATLERSSQSPAEPPTMTGPRPNSIPRNCTAGCAAPASNTDRPSRASKAYPSTTVG